MARVTWTGLEAPPALILRFDRERLPLWDTEVDLLVEELEDRLDGVFVTPAAGSGGPTVRDALAAARFVGCRQAVVVLPPTAAGDHLPSVEGLLSSVTVRSAWGVLEIADAYERACGRRGEMAAGG